ncbi:uncharacterized protein KY384_004160 [Bacidia gigantensis]|uniref:uncharacterized protein n=1 Tax=Bacidia gigantensis TaxID=2732470 RepID=UPI001D052AD0|nr:uncharacterized protein KY384_004160 [Bacidia gigantensis]KAG8530803.1 hypothetical protein KY384_004160 [Bacidia gigantensis]
MLSSSNLLSLPVSVLSLVISQAFLSIASNHPPAASPKAKTDLICHTSNPAECYPTVFSPTKDFQVIRDDQSIPPGLHVRMNLATGLKEARLNIPLDDEDDDQGAIVVIDNGPKEDESFRPVQEPLHLQDSQHPLHALDSTSPPDAQAKHPIDSQTFATLLASLNDDSHSSTPNSLFTILTALTDLAHDMEYGLHLASSRPSIARIMQLIDSVGSHSLPVRSAASSLLATALQNNDKALEALLAHTGSAVTPVVAALYETQAVEKMDEEEAHFTNRLVFLLAQLCEDAGEREEFVKEGGVDALAGVLDKAGHGGKEGQFEKVVARVANFVGDFAERIGREVGSEEWGKMCAALRGSVLGKYERGSVIYESALEAERALEVVLGGRCE